MLIACQAGDLQVQFAGLQRTTYCHRLALLMSCERVVVCLTPDGGAAVSHKVEFRLLLEEAVIVEFDDPGLDSLSDAVLLVVKPDNSDNPLVSNSFFSQLSYSFCSLKV